jgi:hypothetical protein
MAELCCMAIDSSTFLMWHGMHFAWGDSCQSQLLQLQKVEPKGIQRRGSNQSIQRRVCISGIFSLVCSINAPRVSSLPIQCVDISDIYLLLFLDLLVIANAANSIFTTCSLCRPLCIFLGQLGIVGRASIRGLPSFLVLFVICAFNEILVF